MPKKITKFEVDTIASYARKKFRDAISEISKAKENKKLLEKLQQQESDLESKLSAVRTKIRKIEYKNLDNVRDAEYNVEAEVRMTLIFADDIESVKRSVDSIIEKYLKESKNA